jgi:hypothetical protein
MPTDPTNKNPVPQPKQTPWERKTCHFCVANDAPINDSVSNKMPIWRQVLVPNSRITRVATGAIKRD